MSWFKRTSPIFLGLALLGAVLLSAPLGPAGAQIPDPPGAPNPVQETRLDAALYDKIAALKPLTGPTLDGTRGKVTLVTFFASWCPPCREEFRHLNKLKATIPASDLDIVAINLYEDWLGFSDPVKLKRFLRQTKPEFITLAGEDWVIPAFENVTRIPTVFVFDRTGKKTFHFIHIKDAEKMSLTYEELLAAVKPHL